MRDIWESFTWLTATMLTWVEDMFTTWWETSPLSLLLFVIAILTAITVIFRRAN